MKNTNKEINQLKKELFKYLCSKAEKPTIDSVVQFVKSFDPSRITSQQCDDDKNPILVFNLMIDVQPELRSNILSLIGAPPELFNPGTGTNFIYEVIPPEGVKIDVDKFNADTYPIKGRVSARIQSLLHDYNCSLAFVKTQSNCLYQNLRTIDGDMPDLLSRLLIVRYEQGLPSVQKATQYITSVNPYGYDIESHGEIYQYKVKRFLQDCAMGMTPEKPWTGFYDATGGQIIVKGNGEVVCYHVYEINRFLEYLFNSTIFEGASTGEDDSNPGHPRPDAKKNYFYGWLYKENEHYYIKLNLQVRFK
jgi:hypothetical protein